ISTWNKRGCLCNAFFARNSVRIRSDSLAALPQSSVYLSAHPRIYLFKNDYETRSSCRYANDGDLRGSHSDYGNCSEFWGRCRCRFWRIAANRQHHYDSGDDAWSRSYEYGRTKYRRPTLGASERNCEKRSCFDFVCVVFYQFDRVFIS